MLTKIKRKKCLEKYEVFPLRHYDKKLDDEIDFYPKTFGHYILTVSARSLKGHISILGKELIGLMSAFEVGSLIFLGDTKTAWLYQENGHPPVKRALEYLAENGIGKRFKGAIQVDEEALPVFISHLAWLIRCNAALPYFHFTQEKQNIVGSICKYGNLHLSTLNKKADKRLRTFIDNSKFEYFDGERCYDIYTKTGSIPGRQTIV